MIRILIALGAILVLGTPADAQERIANSFEQLQILVGPGDRVSVRPENAAEISGRITTLSATQLVIATGGRTEVFEAAQPLRIRQRRGDSLKNGALIGLGAGVGVALALVATSDGLENDDTGWVLLATGVYGAMGTGIGVGIDALIRGRPLIYDRRSTPAAVSLLPVVGARRAGAILAFRF